MVLRASGGPSVLKELSDEDAVRLNVSALAVFVGGEFETRTVWCSRQELVLAKRLVAASFSVARQEGLDPPTRCLEVTRCAVLAYPCCRRCLGFLDTVRPPDPAPSPSIPVRVDVSITVRRGSDGRSLATTEPTGV